MWPRLLQLLKSRSALQFHPAHEGFGCRVGRAVLGLADTEGPPNQSELLYEALRAHDSDVTLSLVDGLEHGFLELNDFDPAPARRQRVKISRPGEPEHKA